MVGIIRYDFFCRLKGDEYSCEVPFIEETYDDEYLDGLEMQQEAPSHEEVIFGRIDI